MTASLGYSSPPSDILRCPDLIPLKSCGGAARDPNPQALEDSGFGAFFVSRQKASSVPSLAAGEAVCFFRPLTNRSQRYCCSTF